MKFTRKIKILSAIIKSLERITYDNHSQSTCKMCVINIIIIIYTLFCSVICIFSFYNILIFKTLALT